MKLSFWFQVNDRVATAFEINKQDSSGNTQNVKQMPQPVYTLRKKWYLYPVTYQPGSLQWHEKRPNDYIARYCMPNMRTYNVWYQLLYNIMHAVHRCWSFIERICPYKMYQCNLICGSMFKAISLRGLLLSGQKLHIHIIFQLISRNTHAVPKP